MPSILREQTIATVTTVPNLLAGSVFEFARGNILMVMGVTQAATGMFVTINAGSDIVAEEFSPPVLTRYPIIPDEMQFTAVAQVGDRIVISVRNPTGGGIIARALVQITNV